MYLCMRGKKLIYTVCITMNTNNTRGQSIQSSVQFNFDVVVVVVVLRGDITLQKPRLERMSQLTNIHRDDDTFLALKLILLFFQLKYHFIVK